MFVELAARDLGLREQLLKEGKLFGGYNPEMEALQVANGRILQQHIEQHGWPEDEVESKAAWLVLAHAISMPELQQNAVKLFSSNPSLVPTQMVAMLEDRVLVFLGKKQKFGTQFDWDENGELNPYPLEDPDTVDALRIEKGLPTLAQRTIELREHAKQEGEKAMQDRDQYLLERLQWMVKVGWIDNIDDVDSAYKPAFLRNQYITLPVAVTTVAMRTASQIFYYFM
jgi:hypothetical protein